MTTVFGRVILLMAALSATNLTWAHCDQTVVSVADQDLWDTHGCIPAVYLWACQGVLSEQRLLFRSRLE
jgi:hypothetical protein